MIFSIIMILLHELTKLKKERRKKKKKDNMESERKDNPKIYTDDWMVKGDDEYKETIIKEKDFAKIGKREGFWVLITKMYPNNKFVGEIMNNLVLPASYGHNDFVSFHRNNIIEFRSSQKVIVSDVDYVFFGKR
jgi:hypothetical protein